MRTSDRAVLNVATSGGGHGSSWYSRGAKRLMDSLDKFNTQADYLFWKNKYPVDCPPHQQVPYFFKPKAFREAQHDGYDMAIWIDASCWLVKPLDEAWEQIKRDGYLIGLEGWTVGDWCSDEVLKMAGYDREQARKITLMEGKIIGLDLTSPVGNRFLDRWEKAAQQGWFNGSHSDHRHDISAGGIIAYEMGLKLTEHTVHLGYRGTPHPDVFIRSAGL